MVTKVHHSCTQIRRMLIKTGTLNMVTGKTEMHSQEWVTKACDAPLFGETEKATGICRSCAGGWTHPDNYPVNKEA